MRIPGSNVIVNEGAWSARPRSFRIGKVSLHGLKVELTDAYESGGAINLKMAIAERQRGEPIELTFRAFVGFGFSDLTQREQAELLRASLFEFLKHEISELVQDGEGKSFEDPHG